MKKAVKAKVFIDEKTIKKRVKELGKEISKYYGKEEIVIVGILKGSFIFLADLVRKIKTPVLVDFMIASSYQGTRSSGKIEIKKDVSVDVANKHVLIVEDIVDTGLTMKVIAAHLLERKAKSVEICAFLSKPTALKHKVKVKFNGFTIKDEFVVGYGLDYEQRSRQLPYVAKLKS